MCEFASGRMRLSRGVRKCADVAHARTHPTYANSITCPRTETACHILGRITASRCHQSACESLKTRHIRFVFCICPAAEFEVAGIAEILVRHKGDADGHLRQVRELGAYSFDLPLAGCDFSAHGARRVEQKDEVDALIVGIPHRLRKHTHKCKHIHMFPYNIAHTNANTLHTHTYNRTHTCTHTTYECRHKSIKLR